MSASNQTRNIQRKLYRAARKSKQRVRKSQVFIRTLRIHKAD